MAKTDYMRIQFLQLISQGPEQIQQCFNARFNNTDTRKNFSNAEQETFFQTLKQVLNSETYYRQHWEKIGANCNLDDLRQFTSNDTIRRLEQELGDTIIGDNNDHSMVDL